ncbi:MBL fold metallo-hydrolase [Haliangium ochraceum]|uniref:Hydroxyacylglutathione hydrolase n=1 Tax=Haliangium ochraceum (strain DSM 14365 / JCM 11303 / SMP-2) TaxID=502025 RepID=D0LH70_HALO1|nr:MBL fold metallo-hydrolase [Haliangium ochraceum]ACY18215.1 Hydroxyacylglutathione hydrolase [Haliangium ochraceum DSM 14365]
MATEGIFVHQFALGPWDNFLYFIGDKATRTCAVVDPAWDARSILDEAAKLDVSITHMLCTHSHFDHVDQVEPLLAEIDAQVHMLGEEIDFSGFRCENLVRHSPGDSLTIGKHAEILMMHTPGHTPGSVSYRLPDSVVTGDTLFVEGCGRCDFIGGDPELMYATLHGLVDKLPGQTVVYPGHDYGSAPHSTLTAELENNPYFKKPTLAEFVAHRMDGKTPGSPLPPKPDWKPER